MAEEVKFIAWERSRLFDNAQLAEDGRVKGELQLKLTDSASGAMLTQAPAEYRLAGPGDIAGLAPGTVRHMAPPPLARDAETTKYVHVDLGGGSDLPWRYSPAANPSDGKLRPWIVLLVGKLAEITLRGNHLAILDLEVLRKHDLKKSYQWAHVQRTGLAEISRLVSPRSLDGDSDYLAAIVPAFTPAGADAWTDSGLRISTLPAYHAWRFSTGPAGDFETLAGALNLVKVEGLGQATLRVPVIDQAFKIRGALTTLLADDTDAEALAAAMAYFDELNNTLTDPAFPDRRLIGLPNYGRPWAPDPDDMAWGRALNEDPRQRGTAGLGLWMGILGQDELLDAAAAQAGALDEAAHRLRQLAFGVAASGSLWARHLPEDSRRQLLLFGPTLRRMQTAGGSVMDAITAADSPLQAGLFSSAARRVLRRGTARLRHLKPGANSAAEALTNANTCERPKLDSDDFPHLTAVARLAGLPEPAEVLAIPEFPAEVLDELTGWVGRSVDLDDLTNELMSLLGGGDRCHRRVREALEPHEGQPATLDLLVRAARRCLRGEAHIQVNATDGIDPMVVEMVVDVIDIISDTDLPPVRLPCRPRNLDRLVDIVRPAIDPTRPDAPARQRVCATIEGLDCDSLAPPEFPLGLDFPTWHLLNKHAKEWLLPGGGSIEKDSIAALQTNPAFVDAFLVGLNTQFIGELHWRNIAVDRTSTPLRMFWGFIDPLTAEKRNPDITPLSTWAAQPADGLGAASHQVTAPGDAAGNRNLAVVFRTDLFRRYPATLVYLLNPDPSAADVEAISAANVTAALMETPSFAANHPANQPARRFFLPIFQGSLEPDLVVFIFDVNPDELARYFVVLDEPVSELRFRSRDKDENPLPPGLVSDAAAFAKATLDRPTRVAISGKKLLEGVA